MLKSGRKSLKRQRFSPYVIPIIAVLLLLPLQAEALAVPDAGPKAQYDARKAVLGTIVDQWEDGIVIQEIAIVMEEEGQDFHPEPGSDRLFSVVVTEKTVFDGLAGLADLAPGDDVAVAGILHDTGTADTLAADYIVPLTEMRLSEDFAEETPDGMAFTEWSDEIEGLGLFGLGMPDNFGLMPSADRHARQVSIASFEPEKPKVPLTFRYGEWLDRGGWGGGSRTLVDESQ